MKTREQVEQLKRAWVVNPYNYIEETDGFEEYYCELYDFRKAFQLGSSKEITRIVNKKVVRNIDKIESEYNQDKYAKLLNYYLKNPGLDVYKLREREIGASNSRSLRRTNDRLLISIFRELLKEIDCVIELGCGYGYNLYLLSKYFPDKLYFGGEYSRNAVVLGRLLKVDVVPFNFYDTTWEILKKCWGKTIIFTKHAVEQLPSSTPFVETLRRYKDSIYQVINLEPIYELHQLCCQDEELKLKRENYTIENDYNKDLLTHIKTGGGIIEQQRYNVAGDNPLNPTSLVVWKYS